MSYQQAREEAKSTARLICTWIGWDYASEKHERYFGCIADAVHQCIENVISDPTKYMRNPPAAPSHKCRDMGADNGQDAIEFIEQIGGTVIWPDDVCEWRLEEDTGAWHGPCGVAWEFIDDGPEENGCKFCPRCGKPIKEVK